VSESTRKLIGMILLVSFVGIYSLLVMALGASRIMTLGWAVQLTFYAAAGLLWVPPAVLIIRWMQKPSS
jgi:hypothetical protein